MWGQYFHVPPAPQKLEWGPRFETWVAEKMEKWGLAEQVSAEEEIRYPTVGTVRMFLTVEDREKMIQRACVESQRLGSLGGLIKTTCVSRPKGIAQIARASTFRRRFRRSRKRLQ